MPILLSKRAACERLACSLSTLNRTIATGRLRPVRIGRAVRIPSEELESFLESLKEARNDA
jgi:excisionase family DNA binding protein